jgi:TonB family protein
MPDPRLWDDRHLLTRAVAVSLGFHAVLFFALSVSLRKSETALPVSAGYVVDLVQLEEPMPSVEPPRKGAADTRGEIRLPTERRMPKTKPRTREPREPPPVPVRKEAPAPPPAPVPQSNHRGAGGRMETEVPFDFDYYTEAITRLILSRWVPVAVTADSARAVAHFYIQRDGTIRDLKIAAQSGDLGFDDAALRAVRTVEKFPQLPQGFGWDRLGVRFHFEYRRGF